MQRVLRLQDTKQPVVTFHKSTNTSLGYAQLSCSYYRDEEE